MSENSSEYDIRREKVAKLRLLGLDPYPATTKRTISVQGFLDVFDDLEGEKKTEFISGRVRLQRAHGKLIFITIEDASGRLQIVLTNQDLSEEDFSLVVDVVDVGDIVEVSGTPFVTKKGERSMLAKSVSILTKSVRPLPDKWKGMQDDEARYRRRYVDMIMRPELREMFRMKSIFWQSMRQFLVTEGFLEVETPVLENTPGGADAEPFVTHHKALDLDLYLRISMGELWQKRLMVGGFEKTFEIGRQFRNEGLSPEHLQDYTQMEFYWSFADYEMGMILVERMYKYVVQQTFGKLEFSIRGFDIDLNQSWGRIDYCETILEATGVDVTSASDAELQAAAEKCGVNVSEIRGRGKLIDAIWKQLRKQIAGPVFLVNHPVEVSPLAKRHAGRLDVVERFQVILAGSEVGNGYSELNDPAEQHERFLDQAKLREAGDGEAQMHDEEFVEALEFGMPPTCGFGVSERLFSFLMDKPIKECVMFPLLRPKLSDQSVQTSPDLVVNSVEVKSVDDTTLSNFDSGITRAEAEKLVFSEVIDEGLRRHMLATESIMVALGKHFGASSPEVWGIAGLLHDVDYEKCALEEHSLVGAKMLEERGVHKDVVDAVREHNYMHKIEPKTLMSKTLMCLEQLTGLIIACALVRPDKSLGSVKASSVRKKLKDKSFARGVDREMAAKSEELIGLPLEQAIEICLAAMQQDADKLGLA